MAAPTGRENMEATGADWGENDLHAGAESNNPRAVLTELWLQWEMLMEDCAGSAGKRCSEACKAESIV